MKKFLALISLLSVIGNLVARDIIVNGSVCDMATGEPICGAAIAIKNMQTGAVSDLDGKFTIRVPESAKTLEISFIGYNTKEVAVEPRLTVYLEAFDTPAKPLSLEELREKYCAKHHWKQYDDCIYFIMHPFNYLKNYKINIEDAEKLLSNSGYFSAVTHGTNNKNQLVAIEKDFIQYKDVPLYKKTTIYATFEGERIKECSYLFCYENKSKAKKAERLIKKDIAKGGVDEKYQYKDETEYKFSVGNYTYYVSVYVGENLGRGYLSVDISADYNE